MLLSFLPFRPLLTRGGTVRHTDEILHLAGLQETDNQAEKTNDGAENFDDKNLDEQGRVVRIGNGGTRAGDTDSDTTDKVAEADGDTAPEQGVG